MSYRPARRSSGLYAGNFDGSDAALAEHGAAPAGGHNEWRTADANEQPNNAPSQQKKVPFYKKRWFIISQLIMIPIGIALLFILLFPVVTAVAQMVVNRSHLIVDVAQISNPSNNSFELSMKGTVTNTGVIPAKIEFTRPIDVTWIRSPSDSGSGKSRRAEGEEEVRIGSMEFKEPLDAKNKRATIDQTTILNFDNEDLFGEFAKAMITQKTFKWRLKSDNLRVHAAKFPTSHGVKFDKTLELNGFNAFAGGVRLKSFELPSDHPEGGINFKAVTELNNTSPFSINLGTVVFDLFYEGLVLGRGTGKDTVIKPGLNDVTLEGNLVPRNTTEDLAKLSKLFTNYLNAESVPVIAKGVSTLQADGTAISWLSKGLSGLELTVPFVAPDGKAIAPIKTVDIGSFDLRFSEGAFQWSPRIESDSVNAAIELPFGFKVAIGEIQNQFNISRELGSVAGLATPLGAAKSNISVLSSTMTAGDIDIVIKNTNLSCADSQKAAFSAFNALLTTSDEVPFQLVGASRAVANMSVGMITLDNIKVNVTTKLKGLQGLKGKTIIESVDVRGGKKDQGVDLAINVTIDNPSNLRLATGDLNLRLYRDQAILGTALMPNLTLKMGKNSLTASSLFAANDSPEGLQTLNDFVSKKDVKLRIAGYDKSTTIEPLLEAFKSLDIDVTLPGLKTDLLKTASLKVLPTTGRENNIAKVSVKMNNPFSAALKITHIQSTVSAYGITLGTIDTSTSFSSKPHSDTNSPELDLDMNMDPQSLFTVTRTLAVEAGLDVAAFDGIVQLGGYTYLQTTGPAVRQLQERDNIYTGFNLPKFVQTAFKKLKSDVKLKIDLEIGEYATTLEFTQNGIATVTDESLNLILPVLAKPIVQKIVGGTNLGIDTVLITEPREKSFGTALKGAITNAGPFDASIKFTKGLTVAWNGGTLGGLKMGDVKIIGDVGGDISTKGTFQVADVGRLTEFSKAMITTESFDWEISGEGLEVSAMGIKVPDISLSAKKVTLKGLNNLPGVTISNFKLPSDDPAGGIHIETDAAIPSPAQLGIELGSVTFEASFDGTVIGPLRTEHLTLAPQTTSKTVLSGRMVPQSGANLDKIGGLFTAFLAGKDQKLTTAGQSVTPDGAGGPVSWLSEAIKALKLEVTLPGEKFDIIQAIELKDLDVTIKSDDQAFSPPTNSKGTIAKFKNPFGFSLSVVESAQDITLASNGVDIAQLVLDKAPADSDVSTGNVADLRISWQNKPLKSLNNDAFSAMFTAVTNKDNLELSLKGTAAVTAHTKVGNVPISGIAFNVPSSLKGINAFGHKASLRDVKVTGSGGAGGKEFVVSPLTTTLDNPSGVSLHTTTSSLQVFYENTMIGRAELAPFDLATGKKDYKTEFHYQPADANDTIAQSFLTRVLTTDDNIPLVVKGDADSTPFLSLKQALSFVQLSASLGGLNQPNFITHIEVWITPSTLINNLVSVEFEVHNPLDTSLTLRHVQSDAGLDGEVYARFSQSFDSLTVGPGQTVKSGKFGDVVLVKGALASLGIIPRGILDIFTGSTAVIGDNGYTAPFLKLNQKAVPTKYSISL